MNKAMRSRAICAAALVSVVMCDTTVLASSAVSTLPTFMSVDVDARQISRAMLTVRLAMPLQPSDGTRSIPIAYPGWGGYSPASGINDLMNLSFRCGSATSALQWMRRPKNISVIDVETPARCAELIVTFDIRAVSRPGEFDGIGGTSTPTQGHLNWSEVTLYPLGADASALRVAASIALPEQWVFSTALRPKQQSATKVEFESVTLAELDDSPIMMGRHRRVIDLTPSGIGEQHLLAIFSENPASGPGAEVVKALSRIVAQQLALFGPAPYDHYHFLVLEQKDSIITGLAQRRSNDIRISADAWNDASLFPQVATLLAHEFAHAWNGSARRPRGTGDFDTVIDGRLLWVSEGLTQYLGEVVAARAGAVTPNQFRQRLAAMQGRMEATAGRAWRPLQDTATAVQLMFAAPREWSSARRSDDFYFEGANLWLEIDCLIRKGTRGRRTLDDFVRAFFSRAAGPTYDYDDVVAALGRAYQFDWDAFLRRRLTGTAAEDFARGVEEAGWIIAYDDEPNPAMAVTDVRWPERFEDERFGIGLIVDAAGSIADVMPGSAADRAGLVPGWKIATIDGRRYVPGALVDAVIAHRGSSKPMVIRATQKSWTHEISVHYADGPRYPRLERRSGAPDLLADILREKPAASTDRP